MKIGNELISPTRPVYVIAEIGGNHDGSLDQAKRLIQTAADTGADAAKFQLYRADKLYPGTHTPGAIPDWWLPELKAACHEEGVEFLCSVFDRETLDAYRAVEPAAIKIASPEAADLRNGGLVQAAVATGLPLLVSTGAMTQDDVDGLMDFLFLDAVEVCLLHCVSAYPADLWHMNLGVIPALRSRYTVTDELPMGLSDHTLEPCLAPVIAVTLGACLIEKHLTLDRSLPGPDHPFALEPSEFRMMVDSVRAVQAVLGDGVKRVMPSEDPTDRRA